MRRLSHCVNSVQIRIFLRENKDQKILRIWTLSTQCHFCDTCEKTSRFFISFVQRRIYNPAKQLRRNFLRNYLLSRLLNKPLFPLYESSFQYFLSSPLCFFRISLTNAKYHSKVVARGCSLKSYCEIFDKIRTNTNK